MSGRGVKEYQNGARARRKYVKGKPEGRAFGIPDPFRQEEQCGAAQQQRSDDRRELTNWLSRPPLNRRQKCKQRKDAQQRGQNEKACFRDIGALGRRPNGCGPFMHSAHSTVIGAANFASIVIGMPSPDFTPRETLLYSSHSPVRHNQTPLKLRESVQEHPRRQNPTSTDRGYITLGVVVNVKH